MAAIAPNAPPAWFRIVALIAVAWNLFGVVMYLSSVGMFGDPTVGMSAAEADAARNIPAYITAAFAIGTIFGLIGSVGLLMRKRWAWPVLVASLLALVLLEGWIVFLSGALEAFGGLAIPLTVTIVALLLAWMAGVGRRNGWLR
jgi:hypothetical protein